jgi:hypothetical protein
MTIKFTAEQIENEKKLLQKKIFYLLLIVDPETAANYPDVDIVAAFEDLFSDLDGLNEVFEYPTEMVNIAKKLAKALKEFQSESFEFKKYRKLVLDAGSEVMKIGIGGA